MLLNGMLPHGKPSAMRSRICVPNGLQTKETVVSW